MACTALLLPLLLAPYLRSGLAGAPPSALHFLGVREGIRRKSVRWVDGVVGIVGPIDRSGPSMDAWMHDQNDQTNGTDLTMAV